MRSHSGAHQHLCLSGWGQEKHDRFCAASMLNILGGQCRIYVQVLGTLMEYHPPSSPPKLMTTILSDRALFENQDRFPNNCNNN